MRSYENTSWQIVDNSVNDRMIDGSLIHQLIPSRSLRKSTKILNNKLKKLRLKNYKEYVRTKTKVLRHVVNDTDTDESDNYSDNDYSILYKSSSPSTKYAVEVSKEYTSEEEEQINTTECSSKCKIKPLKQNGTGVKTMKHQNGIINSDSQVILKKKSKSDNESNSSLQSSLDNSPINNSNNIKCNYSSTLSSSSEMSPQHHRLSTERKNKCKEKAQKYKPQKTMMNQSNFKEQIESPCHIVLRSESISSEKTSNLSAISSRKKSCTTAELQNNNINGLTGINANARTSGNNYDNRTSKLLKSVKRNLICVLDNVKPTNNDKDTTMEQSIECTSNHNSSCSTNTNTTDYNTSLKESTILNTQNISNVSLEQPKDSGIDEDSQDKFSQNQQTDIKCQKNLEVDNNICYFPIKCDEEQNIMETINENDIKDMNSCYDEVCKELCSTEECDEMQKSLQFNCNNDSILTTSINEDEVNFVKEGVINDTSKQNILPKIMCTEIVNKKYKIISEKNNNLSSISESTITSNNTLTNNSIEINDNIDNKIPTTLKINNEENFHANDISSVTPTKLQQRIKLNLVPNNDSDTTEDEYLVNNDSVTTKIPKNYDNFDKNEHDIHKNDKCNNIFQEISVDIPICKEASLTPLKEMETSNLRNTDHEIEDKIDTTISSECTHVSNDFFKFHPNVNKTPLKQIQCYKNVDNNNDIHNKSIKDFEETVIDSCECNTLNRDQILSHQTECIRDVATLEEHSSNLNISFHSRPCNLRQLAEDEKLFVETLPASMTLMDITDDDEVCILNIPNKILQHNLIGERLILKEETIRFGKNKYKILQKDTGSISCIFATGKQKKRYKTVNVKGTSIVIVQEYLSGDKQNIYTDDYLDNNTSKPKLTEHVHSSIDEINDQQTDDTGEKLLKEINRNKRKQNISDFDDEHKNKKKTRRKIT